MHELAFEDSQAGNIHSERRQHARRHAHRVAELILRDDQAHYICTIVDESDGGVQVETDHAAALADEVIIKFSDSATQLVRRCWANGNRAGYQFIEIVPVQRHLLQDDQQTPHQVDVVALNNFVAISRALLNLFVENPNCLYSVERICARLSEVPHTHVRVPGRGAEEPKNLQLLTIPDVMNLHGWDQLA